MNPNNENTGNILVVDDEENIRKALKFFFEGKNYSVQLCKNGEEAIKNIQNSAYDLIITDYQMKNGVNGLDVAQEAKKRNKNTSVILMSVYYDEVTEDIYKKVNHKADICIRKPFDLFEVLNVVEGLVNEQNQNRKEVII